MTRLKLSCLLATGALVAWASAAEAGRPWYRCYPRSWSRPVVSAPNQGTVYRDSQGTYRRFSVEPGDNVGVDGSPVVTPSPSGSWNAIPTTPATSTPSHRSIEQRRLRPGQGFGPR